MKITQRPEMEVMSMPTLAQKNSWNHFEGTYFWRVFSHFKPLCSANWTSLNMNASDFHVWRENSRQNEGRQSDVGLLWCNLFQFVAWNLKNRSVSKVCFSSWWCKKTPKTTKKWLSNKPSVHFQKLWKKSDCWKSALVLCWTNCKKRPTYFEKKIIVKKKQN